MSRKGSQRATEPRLPLPRATAEWVQAYGDRERNLGLFLDRFVRRDARDQWHLRGPHRLEMLEEFVGPYTSSAALDALNRRLEGVERCSAAELGGKPAQKSGREQSRGFRPLLLRVRGKLLGKLLVDYGRKGTNEAGLSIHPLYGAPRIPGSAVEGAVRAQARLDGWSERDMEEAFGTDRDREEPGDTTRARAGRVCFLDALPDLGRFSLVLDTLTPHHKRWDSGELELPLETESPEPFSFLAVARATFVFDLMAVPKAHRGEGQHGDNSRVDLPALVEVLGKAGSCLQNALSEGGIGAKTAAGYGWFEFAKGVGA